MIAIIKNDKYDNLINNILFTLFFIHQLCFVYSKSAYLDDNLHLIEKNIINYVIIISFLGMSFTVFYYFLRGKFLIKEVIIYAIISVPLIISLYNYRVVMVISNLFYIAIFKNVNVDKSLKIALIATITGFIINFIFAIFTKYTGNVGQTRYGISRVRYGLGFRYAYFTGYYYLTIVMIYLLVRKQIKYIEYFALFVIGLLIFIFSDAKAAFAYTVLAIIIHLLYVKCSTKFLYKYFKNLVVLAFPIATLLACILPICYVKGNAFWDKFNQIVNGRLELTQNAIANCGWKWFGQTAQLWNPGIHYADSSIVLMLIQNGMVVLIMCVIFMTFFSYMSVKINNKPLMIVLLIIALRSIFDMGFMTMQLGPVVILFYDTLNKYRSSTICDY